MQDYQLSTNELRSTKPKRDEFKDIKRNSIVCVLDNLSNAYNIGIIIRTCEAFLIEKVFVCGNVDLIKSKKLLKTSRKTERWIKVETDRDTTETIKKLKYLGYEIVAVELTKNAIHYQKLAKKEKIAFVFGSEIYGISNEVLSQCDKSIYIPMFGMGNSLNVATSAGIVISDFIFKKYKNI